MIRGYFADCYHEPRRVESYFESDKYREFCKRAAANRKPEWLGRKMRWVEPVKQS